MAVRIYTRYTIPDTRVKAKQSFINSLSLLKPLRLVGIYDSYVVDAKLSNTQVTLAAQSLVNPSIEQAFINKATGPGTFDWVVEIGFLPGVTDNVGATTRETLEDKLNIRFKPGESVYTSQVFFISGKVSESNIVTLAQHWYNPLIQRSLIVSGRQFKTLHGLRTNVPKVQLKPTKPVITVNLNVSDSELATIGSLGIANSDGSRRGPLALDVAYMKAIQSYFASVKRQPTDIELESIAQTWSEHCKHTIFASPIHDAPLGLYKTYIKRATEVIRAAKGSTDFCVSVFTDNSGGIRFDDEYVITHKVETHNSPSALDPFGGAITGIVGVNRDALGFGLGAKPIANTYGFCFGNPIDTRQVFRDAALTQPQLLPERIMLGVIQGVNAGGNCSGIPTPHGFVYFNDRFRGKPLVFVGTVGLIPKTIGTKPSHKKQAQPGDYIVVAGGRVGADGIHGATFSSGVLDSGSPATAVQIGDPITQKKLSDVVIREARGLGLYSSITDNGAGGLSCSVAEMATESGGCTVQLDQVPLKYPGLAPWQIWISESQERMTFAVPPNKWTQFKTLLEQRGVEVTRIGKFTDSGKCVVTYKGKTVMNMSLEFLHNGTPVRQLITQVASPPVGMPVPNVARNFSQDVLTMCSRLNIASFAFISQQYDHEVLANSVVKPLQGRGRVNGDAAVIRPVLNSNRGIVLSYGLYPTYTEINPYAMAASCIDTAVRTAVAAGANPHELALLDNFCWCSSLDPKRLWQLQQACQACYDYAVGYGTPFISGKDSMFNDFTGFDSQGKPVKVSVPPTLLISAIGKIDNITQSVTIDAKAAGDIVYMLGSSSNELGGSEYAALLSDEYNQYIAGSVPHVDAIANRLVYEKLYAAIGKNLVASSIAVNRGGLAIALAKTALSGVLGLDVDITNIPGTAPTQAAQLFSEGQGRIVVTIAPQHEAVFEQLFQSLPCTRLGFVTKELQVRIRAPKTIVDVSVAHLQGAYTKTFAKYE